MASKTFFLPEQVQDYIETVGVRCDEHLLSLAKATESVPGAHMRTPLEQIQLLQFLLRMVDAKKVLEVGTFTGFAALAMAQVIPGDGIVITLEKETTHNELALSSWQAAGVGEKIDLQVAPALDSLDKLLAKGHAASFDFIYIDADKLNYDAYYEAAFKLLKPSGLIGIDNTLWFGRLVQEDDGKAPTKVVRDLNQKIQADDRVDMCMLPIGGGLTLVRKLPCHSPA